jgi:hypothetical protein
MVHRTPVSRRGLLLTLAAFSLISVTSLTGCYEETVAARGVGASGMAIQESRRSNTAADRWFDSVTGDTPAKPTRTGVFPGSTSDRVVPDRLRAE